MNSNEVRHIIHNLLILGFANFRTWPLMSTHFWGEDPSGEWRLVITNGGDRTAYSAAWRLIVYGTKTGHNNRETSS